MIKKNRFFLNPVWNICVAGFTLVEIMIVVAIIAALVLIAVPNMIRSRVIAQDALAKNTLQVLAKGTENYCSDNDGYYPDAMTLMIDAKPPYLSYNYCDKAKAGFVYTCTNALDGYTYVATPVKMRFTGSATFSITTGGIAFFDGTDGAGG